MKHLILLLLTLSLVACGGGGGSSGGSSTSSINSSNTVPNDPNQDITNEPEETYTVSVNVAGLADGDITLTDGEKNFVLTANGEVALAKNYPNGQSFTLSVVDTPEQQNCQLTQGSNITISNNNVTSPLIECSEITYRVAADVTGLDGSVTLLVGEQAIVVTQAGEVVLGDDFVNGDNVAVSIASEPINQDCELDTAGVDITNVDISNLSVTCHYVGNISGQVQNFYTGEPIADALVEAYIQVEGDDEPVLISSAVADENGYYDLVGTSDSERVSIVVNGAGFSQTAVVTNNNTNQSADNDSHDQDNVTLALLPANGTAILDVSVPANVTLEGVNILELPANAVVNSNGDLVTEVFVQVSLIDPSSDPSILPGDYRSVDTLNNIEFIESFGALNIELKDINNEPLFLADGVKAIIRIPLAAKVTTPNEQVLLQHFDLSTSYWRSEGVTTLENINDQLFYRAEVSHFSTWAANEVFDAINVKGCIQNADNEALQNIAVQLNGLEYIYQNKILTSADGIFSLVAKAQAESLIFATNGSISNTLSVITASTDYQVDDCIEPLNKAIKVSLTWGKNPYDLDGRLFIPMNTDEGVNEDHISFEQPILVFNNAIAFLDVDDINAFGPEVITLSDFPTNGRYRYVVHHFNGVSSIANASAKVELLIGEERYIFTPPASEGSERYWAVFDIVVSDGEYEVETVNRYQDSFSAATATAASVLPAKPKAGLIKKMMVQKFYQ